MRNIIERKQDYETQGEFLERIGGNVARMLCLLFLILVVAGTVVHIATAMWYNLVLDIVMIVVFTIALAYRDDD